MPRRRRYPEFSEIVRDSEQLLEVARLLDSNIQCAWIGQQLELNVGHEEYLDIFYGLRILTTLIAKKSASCFTFR
jgi:hypothetical protein